MNKVLFLYSTGNDRATNYLYDGFINKIGREHVIEYPELTEYVNEYVDEIPGHRHTGRYFNYRDQFFNEKDGGKRGWTKEQIVQMAKDGEFEAVFCSCGISVDKNMDILGHIEKVAYLDWSEHGYHPLVFSAEMDAVGRQYFYFKREFIDKTPRRYGNGILFPLPFCVISQQNPSIRNDYSEEKIYDLFFAGNLSTFPTRSDYFGDIPLVLKQLADHRLKFIDAHSEETSLSRNQMLREISSSYMGLSLRGAGMDTFRFWETLSTGTCLVAEKTALIIPNDYQDMHEAVYFTSIGDLKEKFHWLMSHKEAIKEIARNGYEKTLRYHTTTRRAEYVAEIMRLQCFGGKS